MAPTEASKCASGAGKMQDFLRSTAGKTPNRPTQPHRKVPSDDCPVNREDLGTGTWDLLHSMGVYYPDKPSKEYQQKIKNFIETLALMYPCTTCAAAFQHELQKSPPRVDSRSSLSLWLCEQHNVVNQKLGKPLFECSMQKLDERWRHGKKKCWQGFDLEPSTCSTQPNK